VDGGSPAPARARGKRPARGEPVVDRAFALLAWGALERGADGRFSIGVRLWEVASLAPRGQGLKQVALPFMGDLEQVTREHVLLAVSDGDDALLVERLSGHRAVPVL
jgi:DNA-binding IclR family transcriptional regulator